MATYPLLSNDAEKHLSEDPLPPVDVKWTPRDPFGASSDVGLVPALEFSGVNEDSADGLFDLIWPEYVAIKLSYYTRNDMKQLAKRAAIVGGGRGESSKWISRSRELKTSSISRTYSSIRYLLTRR